MESLDHKTATVIIPPEHVWGPFQAIRQKHDSRVGRWMPHDHADLSVPPNAYSQPRCSHHRATRFGHSMAGSGGGLGSASTARMNYETPAVPQGFQRKVLPPNNRAFAGPLAGQQASSDSRWPAGRNAIRDLRGPRRSGIMTG
jgi:hypothetical protein